MHSQVRNYLRRFDGENLAEGITASQLERAATKVREQNLPLRDGIVFREAKAIAKLEEGPAFAIWEQVCEAAKRRLYPAPFAMWIQPIEVAGLKDGELILAAPDPIRTWVERRYLEVLIECLPQDAEITGVRFQ